MSTKLTASANIARYNNNDSHYSGLDRRGPITNASSIELQIVGMEKIDFMGWGVLWWLVRLY